MTYSMNRRNFISGLAGVALAGGSTAALSQPRIRGSVLDKASMFNDRVQAALFDPERRAQTYSPSDVTSPFPFNAFYPESFAPEIDVSVWRLSVSGLVTSPRRLSLTDLRSFPQEVQITRLICIEGWSAVGSWSGMRLFDLLRHVGADLSAKYISLHCADGYHTSIDMASALHPQTILALDFLDRPLPRPFGAPCRLRIPTKLGFKNAKFVTDIHVTDEFPGGYWEDQGYNWFAGL